MAPLPPFQKRSRTLIGPLTDPNSTAPEVDYHRKTPSQNILDDVFRLETERVTSNDGVVRYQNRLLQVKNQGRSTAPPPSKVVVCEWEDDRLEVRYRGQSLNWEEIPELPKPKVRKPERS